MSGMLCYIDPMRIDHMKSIDRKRTEIVGDWTTPLRWVVGPAVDVS